MQYKYSCLPQNETPIMFRTYFSTVFSPPLQLHSRAQNEWTISGCFYWILHRLTVPLYSGSSYFLFKFSRKAHTVWQFNIIMTMETTKGYSFVHCCRVEENLGGQTYLAPYSSFHNGSQKHLWRWLHLETIITSVLGQWNIQLYLSFRQMEFKMQLDNTGSSQSHTCKYSRVR